ncbi:glycosyltransferase [Nostoc sp. CHAB 5844]|nr:glycosyltransferase [Nostoc sp. CHAB 5844]
MDSHPTYTLVYIFTTFPPEVSGSAIFNWERVQEIAKLGIYRVVVLAPNGQGEDVPSVPSNLKTNLIIETYPSKAWLIYQLLRVPTFTAAKQISQSLNYYKPDLITVVDVEGLFWFSTWHLPGRDYAKEHNIPYITEYHTDYYNVAGTDPWAKFLRDILLKPINRNLYHQCDTTLSITPAATKSLQQMGISNYYEIPMYGIDISVFNPSRRSRKWLEPWLTTQEQDNKILLFLGRLAPEKRIDWLIEAFAKLKSRQHKCSLLIAGDGPDDTVNILKRLAEPIPDIHFTGFIHGETKANVLASCDVFCSPSPYETFGRTVVEAMASGIPVVSINSAGVSDYLINEINGYLVPPNDVDGLTSAFEKVLLNNNTQIIQRALQDAQQLTVQKGCESLNKYYLKLLGDDKHSQTLVLF